MAPPCNKIHPSFPIPIGTFRPKCSAWSCAFLIFVSSSIVQMQPTNIMIVAHGEPENLTGFETYSLTWSGCVERCLNNSSCIAIYEVDDRNCQVFTVGQISSVARLSSENRIGVKSVTKSTMCPATLKAYNESGYSYNNSTGIYQPYTVIFDGSVWTFEASSTLKCPTNFTMFVRDLGPWCMNVIDSNGCFNQSLSSQKCKSTYGGVLSGLETTEEYDFVILKAQLIPSTPVANVIYGFWVDGTRKSTCLPVSNKTASCNGTNEFTFSDPTISAVPGGYSWGAGQPDGLSSTDANCLVVRVRNKTSFGVDDCSCTMSSGELGKEILCYNGYVCGLSPSNS